MSTEQKPEWQIETEDDKAFGIETKRYENGQVMKQCKLSDGRMAVVRRLKGSDTEKINRITGGDTAKFQDAIVTTCLEVDGKPVVIEEVENMWFDDKTLIIMMASINFPTTRNI